MDRFNKVVLAIVAIVAVGAIIVSAQSIDPAATRVQNTSALYPLTAISATAAVNNQVTLTIPAPPTGWYNYVCSLSYHASQDGTAHRADERCHHVDQLQQLRAQVFIDRDRDHQLS